MEAENIVNMNNQKANLSRIAAILSDLPSQNAKQLNCQSIHSKQNTPIMKIQLKEFIAQRNQIKTVKQGVQGHDFTFK